jgi:hypothetical protein
MQVWRIPIAIGVLSLVGLCTALFGDGIWDLLSWALLAIPVWAGIWFALITPRDGLPHSRESNESGLINTSEQRGTER